MMLLFAAILASFFTFGAEANDSFGFVVLPSTGKCSERARLTEQECQNLDNGGSFANWAGAGTWSLPETCGCYIDQNGSRYFNRLTGACNDMDIGERVICKDQAPRGDECVWVRTNRNTAGEKYAGLAYSKGECINRVLNQCPGATIANMHESQNDCWCQYGTNMKEDENSSYMSCLLSTMLRDYPAVPPSISPTISEPTKYPTQSPTSSEPTKAPSKSPSKVPTYGPTPSPTSQPTVDPTKAPSKSPSRAPTYGPTPSPTSQPTVDPTKAPSKAPTFGPTPSPTSQPTVDPTEAPSKSPSRAPTYGPTPSPTSQPTVDPTKAPSKSPSKAPTFGPTPSPTSQPTVDPTRAPSNSPSKAPTPSPTSQPTVAPTKAPSHSPSNNPSSSPTTSSPSTSPTAGDFIVKVQGYVGDPQDFVDWEMANREQPRMNAYQFDFVRQLKRARQNVEEHLVEFCQSKSTSLTCPKGFDVAILSASVRCCNYHSVYNDACPHGHPSTCSTKDDMSKSQDRTSWAQQHCNGKSECTVGLWAGEKHNRMSDRDVCFGYSKMAMIKYQCTSSQRKL